ncbi:phosphopantothenoylcysteine decarboxylase [Roseburia sp. BX1005]|uniref:Phosphopantothenoylcysteine decarboxylase n=1 Tax=Roseburia zhanii TaxID=2763064 RepID=A0A923RSS9_9FIRM|nr:flavoprotein [Roseburia zhanii]MBC5713962.1 phosphopantothenoylcysteine decarboxylase [Roseburia zhanii]
MKKNIILGITGSIAAYKAADIANTLTKEGHSVHVIMTKAAMEFITPLTLQTLTKNKVHTDQFAPYIPSEVEHISLAQKADLFLAAPASADFIAKAAAGIADDMLTTVLLAARNIPIFVAPAMNTAMYENPITQRNIKMLTEFGFQFIEPREALLACGDLGKGALAETEDILSQVRKALQ